MRLPVIDPAAPVVTFVVPTYKLAALLGECLRSIVAQSFGDYEVLVMDDNSPDDSASVVASIADPRIRHVRNPSNLGHLANYNKGLRLARGRYLWLISADDKLRSPEVLARFVAMLENDPRIAFVFCPAMGLRDGHDAGVVPFCWNQPDAAVMDGREFLKTLIERNVIAAPAVLARTQAYRDAGLFPMDLPYAGDWYLWCRFALSGRVAYLPEPMVHYRLHAHSMTASLSNERPEQMVSDDIAVRWRVMHDAVAIGDRTARPIAQASIVRDYCARVMGRDAAAPGAGPALDETFASIRRHARSPREESRMRAALFEEVADALRARGRAAEAGRYYEATIREAPPAWRAVAKRALLPLGDRGDRLRAKAAAVRAAWFPARKRRSRATVDGR